MKVNVLKKKMKVDTVKNENVWNYFGNSLINQIKFLYTINFSIHAVYTNMFLIPLKTYLFFVDVK